MISGNQWDISLSWRVSVRQLFNLAGPVSSQQDVRHDDWCHPPRSYQAPHHGACQVGVPGREQPGWKAPGCAPTSLLLLRHAPGHLVAQELQTGRSNIWLARIKKVCFIQKSDEKSAKYRNAGNSQFSRTKLREFGKKRITFRCRGGSTFC